MLVHTVIFWLKEETTTEQRDAFRKGLESLADIETVAASYVGTPSTTDRPVIDKSYTFCLTNIFEGMAEHDTYQTHPIHDAFVADHLPHAEKVQIYDAD